MAETGRIKETKRPKKAAGLTIRMTADTREALGKAATDEGRSVSEMAERWLDAAHRGHADYQARLGGSQVSEAIEAMLDFAGRVQREIGDPRSFLPARDALLAGWKMLIDRALPYTPDTPEGVRYREIRAKLAGLCHSAAIGVLKRAAAGDERALALWDGRAHGGPVSASENVLASLLPSASNVVGLLEDAAADPVKANLIALQTQIAKAEPPGGLGDLFAEIVIAIEEFSPAYVGYMAPRVEAARRGRDLAETMLGALPIATQPGAASA